MKAPPMIVHPFEPESRMSMPMSALDETRLALEHLLDGRYGKLRIADALVTLASELVVREAGPRGTSAWLRRVADEVGSGQIG